MVFPPFVRKTGPRRQASIVSRNRLFARVAPTACGETQAAQFSRWGLERRCIPPEPCRFAALCVAFRSKYTRYSSLTRLVSRAPHRSRRSPGFHHRLPTSFISAILARTAMRRDRAPHRSLDSRWMKSRERRGRPGFCHRSGGSRPARSFSPARAGLRPGRRRPRRAPAGSGRVSASGGGVSGE